VTQSGIEPTTFQAVAQYLTQLSHCLPHKTLLYLEKQKRQIQANSTVHNHRPAHLTLSRRVYIFYKPHGGTTEDESRHAASRFQTFLNVQPVCTKSCQVLFTRPTTGGDALSIPPSWQTSLYVLIPLTTFDCIKAIVTAFLKQWCSEWITDFNSWRACPKMDNGLLLRWHTVGRRNWLTRHQRMSWNRHDTDEHFGWSHHAMLCRCK
jgi:hypothetical protein